jgi:hypothetical protein
MNPLLILTLIDAALTLIERAQPLLKDAFSNGEITPEQQAALAERIAKLRDNPGLFDGPEWKL